MTSFSFLLSKQIDTPAPRSGGASHSAKRISDFGRRPKRQADHTQKQLNNILILFIGVHQSPMDKDHTAKSGVLAASAQASQTPAPSPAVVGPYLTATKWAIVP